MAIQPVDRKRCLSCERWGGTRRAGEAPLTVEYDEHNDRGPCVDGPWHGSPRGPRNACGQWVMWPAIRRAED